MNGSGRAKVWVAVGVVAVLVASSLGMWVFTGVAPGGSVPAGSNAPGSAGSPADVATSLNSAPASPAATPQTPATTGAQAAADRALAAAAADHISPRDVLPPRPSATSAEVASAHTAGYVSPLYHATPAPIGLTEYGLRAGANGTVVPFILNTTSVRSTFDSPAAGAANATYLVDSSPDGWGVQLNSVVTNVTLFGGSTYQFWTQDVAEYFPVAHQLYLVTNVWNFSGSSSVLSLNAFYNHGPLGQQVGTQFYYASYGPVTVSYPFNITFTLTSGLSGGRNIVDFSTNVVATHGSVSLPDWDYVTFNSRTATGPPVSSPANYTADGFHYNPLGLTNDFEMTMGGPGGGSQVTLLAANATETLDYWNATTSSYQAVPSAYSYGGETGETAVGATMSWASSGSSPYGIMSTGPSILGGLWNASSPAGGPATIDLHLHPSNAFVLLATSGASRSAFNVSETEWAPTVRISTLTVPAGNYTVTIELADYDLQTLHLTLAPGSVTDVYANLSLDPTQGIYTPLWAWTNAQIGNLSSSGAGTQNDPYQLWNNQYAPIAAFWGQLNDFGFQVFPGVFFEYTTAYAVFADPAPLTVDLVSAHYPATNALPWWFYGDRNVAVVNATNISGWFDAQASNYPYFLSFNVIVWNSSSFLFANDHFDTEAQALILYGGTGTTVWGSHFIQISPPASSHALVSFSQGIGVSEQENGDLLYNNYFTSPTTAETYPADLYSGAPATYTDTWNVSVQAATNVHHSANWPQFALSGSILGTATQGGNFWWDYGLVQTTYGTSNPFSTLPYSENGAIVVGGDSAPLLASGFYSVTLVAGGIASGAAWSFVASLPSSTQDEYDSGVTTSASVSIGLPNGSYLATGSSGVTPSVRTPFTVAGDTSVVLAFSSGTYAVAFGETGLPVATSWSVTLGGNTQHTRSSTIAFAEPNGTYGYTLGSVAGYVAYPSGGQVTVFGANPAPVAITFVAVHPVDYNVTFAASGLTGGATWSATINGETNSTSGATITFQEVNGSYPYEVASAAPWAPIVATGIVDVQGGDVATAVAFEFTYTVTFSESGLPPGASWNASLGTRLATGAGARIAFPLVANGSYAFNASAPNFLASPAHGLVVVVGADTSFPLVFVPISPAGTYTVSFAETRLPASSSFSVTFDGSTTVASGLVSFTAVAPGSYGYSVASAGAWVPWTNASGTVEVTNASQVLEVAFEFTYAVLFTATGLSSAVDWTVTVIDPTTEFAAAQTSSTPSIVFDLPNGTYAWTVNASGGYTPSPSVGVTTVSGSGHTAAISLGSPGGSSSGIAAWVWIVLAAVIVVVVAAVALAVIRRRRPPAT